MKNVVLTGFMGVEKTSVGKRLAKRLGMEFFYIDAIIAKEEGKTIPLSYHAPQMLQRVTSAMFQTLVKIRLKSDCC